METEVEIRRSDGKQMFDSILRQLGLGMRTGYVDRIHLKVDDFTTYGDEQR